MVPLAREHLRMARHERGHILTHMETRASCRSSRRRLWQDHNTPRADPAYSQARPQRRLHDVQQGHSERDGGEGQIPWHHVEVVVNQHRPHVWVQHREGEVRLQGQDQRPQMP